MATMTPTKPETEISPDVATETTVICTITEPVTTEPEIDWPDLTEAILALRVAQGHVPQGIHCLYNDTEGVYCALGVLGRAMGLSDYYLDQNEVGGAEKVQEHYGIDPHLSDLIIHYNDSQHLTFSEIADRLESGVWQQDLEEIMPY